MKLSRCLALLIAGSCLQAVAATVEPQPTVVVSEKVDMTSTDALTTFVFTKNVVVTATNLRLTCDRLEVISTRKGDPTAAIGKLGRFKSLLAEGNVYIVQSDRDAACGRAEVLPDDDKIILTDHPVVRDLANGATATGPKMTLHRGERHVTIEGEESAPSRIILPAIKDLGFDKDKDKDAKPATPEGAKEAKPATPPPAEEPKKP